ncbi:putative CRISPR-associated protein, APE2256 family [Clostridium cochlearium]|uniref:CRISPR-associated protein, APE2256 family n=1 Tax=Clostridium cochlearium TaxID=1494 RepID=A0ABY0QP22_CLOCO|nr:putative CRISPR-associated protein [Clostridium cochlearium]SDL41713.1 putative CRISPR-associated protein, APE2256 family [Clostridium cochlearium]
MGKIIISTVGTSLFSNVLRKKENEKFTQKYNELKKESDNGEYIKSFIKEKIKTSNNINEMSAEIKSLNKIGVNKDDILFFLSTDTREGKLASQILKDYFNENYNSRAYIENIEGLQVNDAEVFRKKGIKNLIEKMLDILEKYQYEEDIIFNPTGGFKGVVPYITLTGMIYKKKITYIFEQTEGLITLPPIPIDFNFPLIKNTKIILISFIKTMF